MVNLWLDILNRVPLGRGLDSHPFFLSAVDVYFIAVKGFHQAEPDEVFFAFLYFWLVPKGQEEQAWTGHCDKSYALNLLRHSSRSRINSSFDYTIGLTSVRRCYFIHSGSLVNGLLYATPEIFRLFCKQYPVRAKCLKLKCRMSWQVLMESSAKSVIK